MAKLNNIVKTYSNIKNDKNFLASSRFLLVTFAL